MNEEPKTASSGDDRPKAGDETFGWTETEHDSSTSGGAQATAERMLSQLQSMIDSLATQAAPVAKQIGAKAAELAAAAADRAGPLAQKAAEATVDASGKLAERSRTWAAELRRDTTDDDLTSATNGAGSATAVLDPEDAPDAGRANPLGGPIGEDPAEGPRA